MKSIKTLFALGMAVAFSQSVVAETTNPLNAVKSATKEAATTQMTQQVNQTKQAVTSVQNSAKSAVTAKVTENTATAKNAVTSAKEKAISAKNTTTQAAKTARDTLNSAKKGKININTADVETLQALDGIGEAKAKAIVEYRKKHGAFKKASDLTKVSGIGEATLNNIKSSISIQ